MRSKLSVWLQAVRAFSFTASMIPVFLGAAAGMYYKETISWHLLPLVVVCSFLFHAGTNVVSDYFDFKRGVDQDYTFGSSNVLTEELLSPKDLLIGGLVFFAVGSLLGLILVSIRGLPMLVIGIIGLLGGFFYTASSIGYKYKALGDIMVFILMGPLMVIGSYLALTGHYHNKVLYLSLPIGFLVTAILSANNLRDINHDREAKIKTLANVIGHSAAQREYLGLILSAYLAIIVMVTLKTIPAFSLIVFISFPVAIKNMKCIMGSRQEDPNSIATSDIETAKLHCVFGLLLTCSILIVSFLR